MPVEDYPMKKKIKSHVILLGAFPLLILVLAACNFPTEPDCDASVYIVTKTEDTNDGACTSRDCSLREAILLANACEGEQAIYLPSGIYAVTRMGDLEDEADSGDFDILDDLILEGESAIVDGSGYDRVFDIPNEGVNVEIRSISVQNGRLRSTGEPYPESQLGGGIRNAGSLVLRDVDISWNYSESVGGIYNSGTTRIFDGSIESNSSNGGITAISNHGGEMTLQNVYVSDNFSTNFRSSSEVIANNGMFTAIDTTIQGSERGRCGGGNNYRFYGGLMNLVGPTSIMRLERVNVSKFCTFAIRNLSGGQLTVVDSTVADNHGAALDNIGFTTVERSTFSRNGVYWWELENTPNYTIKSSALASLALNNVTISGNSPSCSGPCVVVLNSGRLSLSHVTLFDNDIAGIETYNARIGSRRPVTRVEHSIIAGNEGPNCSGEESDSLGHNLFDDSSCDIDFRLGDISIPDGEDLLLGPLADNGGPTWTHALLSGSPAIDAAGTDCLATDQRGEARPDFYYCDIGAFELLWESPIASDHPKPFPIPPSSSEDMVPPEVPLASFTKNANCRRGPSTAYGIVTSLLEGQDVMLEGRNADNSWWWVLIPESTAHCWVSDTVVEVSGVVAELPLIAAPPLPTDTPTPTPKPPKPKPTTPQPSPPAAPAQLTITKRVCTDTEYSVTLGWMDIANNEDGYRVFRDGQLIATLAKNATGYKDNPSGSGPYTYGVEAFNAAGSSQRPAVYEDGCLP
jgi:CSLREA domain-containing protein